MKGYALLVGADTLNYDYYGENKDLCSSFTDTKRMSEILSSTGNFDESNMFIRNSVNTKWSYLLNDLNYIKRETKDLIEENYIFLYFSGHGASLPNPLEPTADNKQFLCLYDQLVLDCMILEQLNDFTENCKIFIVFDSCYSQGFEEVLLFKSVNQSSQIKSLSEEFGYIFKLHYTIYKDMIMKYEKFHFSPKAEIFFLFACGVNDTTNGGPSCGEMSDFTGLFCSKWNDLKNKPHKTYLSLLKELEDASNKKVKHKIIQKKSNSFFNKSFPFIIKS